MSLGAPIRRKTRRIAASVPVRIEWQISGGDILRSRGFVRDISAKGVYCYLEHPLAVGLEVEFDLLFPHELVGGLSQVYRCRGRVLRTDKLRSLYYGIALSILVHRPIDVGRENQRTHLRSAPASPLVAFYTGLRSVVRDLSLGGAFIEDPEPFPEGRLFKIQVQSPSIQGTFIAETIVRRAEWNVGMAVEFVSLSEEANRRLQELLERVTVPPGIDRGGPISRTG